MVMLILREIKGNNMSTLKHPRIWPQFQRRAKTVFPSYLIPIPPYVGIERDTSWSFVFNIISDVDTLHNLSTTSGPIHKPCMLSCKPRRASRTKWIVDIFTVLVLIFYPLGGTTYRSHDLPYGGNLEPWPNVWYEIPIIGRNGVSDLMNIDVLSLG